MEIDIVTKKDIQQLKGELLKEMRDILKENDQRRNTVNRQWMRSSEVRDMLDISSGTLQNLRVNGILPYRKIGGTMYYQRADIEKMLEGEANNG